MLLGRFWPSCYIYKAYGLLFRMAYAAINSYKQTFLRKYRRLLLNTTGDKMGRDNDLKEFGFGKIVAELLC